MPGTISLSAIKYNEKMNVNVTLLLIHIIRRPQRPKCAECHPDGLAGALALQGYELIATTVLCNPSI